MLPPRRTKSISNGRVLSNAGFTLVELLVVITIIGVLVSLLLPAVQSARESARSIQCKNNLRQFGLAMSHYAEAHGGFPPAAISWQGDNMSDRQTSGTQWYHDHGWLSQIAPQMEQQNWFDKLDFNKVFCHPNNEEARRFEFPGTLCPSDIGAVKSEWESSTFARYRGNYVVNFGNTNYGQDEVNANLEFLGAPFTYQKITKMKSIKDGLTSTLMMSEVKIVPELSSQAQGQWTTLSDIYAASGGQVFVGVWEPNSSRADLTLNTMNRNELIGYTAANDIPDPGVNNDPLAQRHYARSHHVGGVNATLCDASTHFFAESIDTQVWRALSTAKGGEIIDGSEY